MTSRNLTTCCIFAMLLGICFAYGLTKRSAAEQLDAARRDAFIAAQLSPGFECQDFFNWLNTAVAPNGTFMLSNIGAYRGPDQIQEYYQLAIKQQPGLCSNFANTQFLRLDNVALPTSIYQVSEDIYEGYHITDGSFNPNQTTGEFKTVTKGHLTFVRVKFLPNDTVIDTWQTDVENDELTTVSVANSPISDPFALCGLLQAAQQVFEFRFGYNPANESGFNFSLPGGAGFFDCANYWAGIQARGDVCGTPLSTHTLSCPQLHATTFLTEGSRKVHPQHWAKEPLHTKCIDFCKPVLATCHPNASKIPRNKINFDNGEIEYFCECPPGWVGDGLAAGTGCQPIACTQDWQCHPNSFAECDTAEGVCKPKETFDWDRDAGLAFCPDNSRVVWNNGVPECILNWRCRERWQCNNQNYNRVQCLLTGNLATPDLGACVCNRGFTGGYVVECDCESGNTVFVNNNEYCLAEGECAFDWNCDDGQSCSIPSGDIIGTCQ